MPQPILSKPAFYDVFTLDTRRNRESFAMFFILTIIVLPILLTLLFVFPAAVYLEYAHPAVQFVIGILFYGILAMAMIAFATAILCYSIQRCNDIGISRLWAIVVFCTSSMVEAAMRDPNLSEPEGFLTAIRFIFIASGVLTIGFWLFLLFKKGQDGPNAFGPNPLDVDWGADEGAKAAPKASKTKAVKKKAAKTNAR